MMIKKKLCWAIAASLGLPIVGNAFELEEVVVTATKRAEIAQDIPMSIEAVSGDTLVNQGIGDMSELSGSVPNLNVGTGLGATYVTVRGMGSGNDRNFEQSVGLFVDNIYMPRSAQYRSAFMDVERVEVLRGTQAVLFGLNSTAGAISIHSAKNRPGDEFEGSVHVEYETEYDVITTNLMLGGSVSDNLALRFAGKYSEGDSFIENASDGKPVGDKELSIYRLSAVWEPSNTVTVEGKVEHIESESLGSNVTAFTKPGDYTLKATQDGLLSSKIADATLWRTEDRSDRDQEGYWEELDNVVVKVDVDLSGYTLTALAGYSEMISETGLDLDAGPLPFFMSTSMQEYEQSSIEFRIASSSEADTSYVAGVYYQDADLHNDSANFLSRSILGAGFGLTEDEWTQVGMNQDISLYSAFATATWNISDDLRLIGGLRYVHEEKEASRYALGALETAPGSNVWREPDPATNPTDSFLLFAATFDGEEDDRTSENVMGEVMLQWDVTSDIMTYLKLGTSAKSGGFASSLNLPSIDNFEYEDEEAKSIEIGMKSSLADGAAELNFALFYTEYDKLQVNSFDPATASALTTNAGSSISQGIELEGRWMLTEWLLVGGSVAYLDATYDEFEMGPTNSASAPSAQFEDLGGKDMPFSPEWSGNLHADVTLPLGNAINFVSGVKVSFKDEFYTDGSLDPLGEQDAYVKVDARVGFESQDETWRVMLLGKNLTDEWTTNSFQTFGGTNMAFLSPPKTVTLQAMYNF